MTKQIVDKHEIEDLTKDFLKEYDEVATVYFKFPENKDVSLFNTKSNSTSEHLNSIKSIITKIEREKVCEIKGGTFITKSGKTIEVKDGYYVAKSSGSPMDDIDPITVTLKDIQYGLRNICEKDERIFITQDYP